jgi:ribonucleotide reductase alpha subunit
MDKTDIFTNDFSREIWETTYKADADNTIQDTFKRIAKAIASVEKTDVLRREWETKFYDLLNDFKFTPGGRIISNAGNGYKGTSLANCFRGPRPKYDIDSIDGIMEILRMQSQTLKSEGGWGEDFSFIRPRGSFIHGVGIESPGPVKFMELFDKSSEVITCGSGIEKRERGRPTPNKKGKKKARKGAQMGTLSCWHPSVVEFIEAKQTPGRLTKFNLSVNCSNEFMDKVIFVEELIKNGAPQSEIDQADKWDLIFPDTTYDKYKPEWDGNMQKWKGKGYPFVVYETISAKWLYDLMMKSSNSRNEPGILFLDVANKTHCWNYDERGHISSTNPCFHGDTVIAVADGRNGITIKQLAEEGCDIPVYTVNKNTGNVEIKWGRNPRITGYDKELLEIGLSDGTSIKVTPNHKFLLMNGDEKEAKDLIVGDSLPNFVKREDVMSKENKKPYYRIISNVFDSGKRIFEHRLVAKFHWGNEWNKMSDELKENGWVKGGIVVHHKDYNGLNNSLENLELMSFSDHSAYHARNDLKGEKNPMFGKRHSEETKRKIGEKTRERFSDEEYRIGFVEKIKKSFNEEKKANMSAGRKKFELERMLKIAEETGLKTFISNNELMVEKICEYTGTHFVVPWRKREICLNPSVCPMSVKEIRDKQTESLNILYRDRSRINLHNQIMAYKDLQSILGRNPFKTEWESECKRRGNITIRFNPESKNPFILPTFKKLQEKSETYNHRVTSIKKLEGLHTVYNVTTEDNHTVGLITNKTESAYLGIFTCQCGEQPMPVANVCDLGSYNLTQFVDVEKKNFNLTKLREYVKYSVRFLDNVIDSTFVPLPQYEEMMKGSRRIGLGLMGWGSALFMLKIRFSSEEAAKLKEELMQTICYTAIETSVELAKEKGMFPWCNPEKHSQVYFWEQIGLPQNLKDSIKKYGIRNSALFNSAPTGNTSIYANIVSGGIEPIFLPEYIRTSIVSPVPDHLYGKVCKFWKGDYRKTEMFDWVDEGDERILKGVDKYGVTYKIDRNRGLVRETLCEDYGVSFLKKRGEWDKDADWAVTTEKLSAEEHIRDLKGWAKWCDAAISKTINIPNDYPFDKFRNIYLDAYKSGVLKGITTYRAGTMASVLSAVEAKPLAVTNTKEGEIPKPIAPKRLKYLDADMNHIVIAGVRYYVAVGLLKGEIYEVFTGCNHDNEGDIIIPKSVKEGQIIKHDKGNYTFVSKQGNEYKLTNGHSDDNADALTRIISIGLRHGTPLHVIVGQLERTKGHMFTFSRVLSRTLKKYIIDGTETGDLCTECGKNLIRASGCTVCNHCGASKCS